MYPSYNPLFYILQVAIIGAAVLGSLYVGLALAQPAALLALFALQYLPAVPMMPSPEMIKANGGDSEGEPGDYDGGKMGFSQ